MENGKHQIDASILIAAVESLIQKSILPEPVSTKD